jgi:autotransporter strand-loop-strand O-heptosyltransferase
MKNELKVVVNYVATVPLEGDSPKVFLLGDSSEELYRIEFLRNDDGKVLSKHITKGNGSLTKGGIQWFVNWKIDVYRQTDNTLMYSEKYNPSNKVVFIKFDGFALGDNIAWIPYVEEFRKKHNCTVICSTFHNYMFKNIYSKILFVKPNTVIENVYSQHYIGASKNNNAYCPINYENSPLQKMASKTLGIEHVEIRPNLEWNVSRTKSNIEGKYVCISEFASHEKKHWKHPGGWQSVVDLLTKKGYKVAVISKEPTQLKNVIDLTGSGSLKDRMVDIYHSEFYMGVSSGLAWLAWGLSKKVIMISDCTPSWCEFKENNYRVIKRDLDSINYKVDEHSSFSDVSEKIIQLIGK